MPDLPRAPIERLMREAGAERVSADAKEALAVASEEYIRKIAGEALKFAKNAGRKTVLGKDVRMAVDLYSSEPPGP